ncbi:MAG: DUF1854 domain-containing protein [Pirellula sp.]|jgi:hypothetical protein
MKLTANPQAPSETEVPFGVPAEYARDAALRQDGRWRFTLARDQWSHLQLTDSAGKVYRDVTVVPLFPVATPKEWISILASNGDELVSLRDLSSLAPSDRELVEQELAFREFVPQILKVLWVSGTQEPCEWEVETNHGKTRFVLNSEEDVRRVSAWTVHFMDASGGRFWVEDIRKLDSRSRAYVEWYV